MKTRPVRAPGLQEWPNWTIYCRPGAFTRRFGGVFKQALRGAKGSKPAFSVERIASFRVSLTALLAYAPNVDSASYLKERKSSFKRKKEVFPTRKPRNILLPMAHLADNSLQGPERSEQCAGPDWICEATGTKCAPKRGNWECLFDFNEQ